MAGFTLAIAISALPLAAQADHPPTAFMFTNRVVNTSLRMPQSSPDSVADFPQALADTGAFAELATLTPQPGIVPFEVNLPRRWIVNSAWWTPTLTRCAGATDSTACGFLNRRNRPADVPKTAK
jgi:hypothetical protein